MKRLKCFFKGHKWHLIGTCRKYWNPICKYYVGEKSHGHVSIHTSFSYRCDCCNGFKETILKGDYSGIAQEDLINVD